jgi:hypothetical protein
MKPTTSPFIVKATAFAYVFILMFAVTSCNNEESDSVNQDKIYTVYEFNYDKNTDITYARAWFRFGNLLGTPLQLKFPANVVFNGDTMAFKSTLSYYELQFPGQLTNGAFIYKDHANTLYTNTITMAKAVDLPPTIATINRNTNTQISCMGDSLGASEKFETKVTGPDNSNIQYFSTSGVGAHIVTLLSSQLMLINPGTGSVRLEREYKPTLQQKTLAGGSISSTYTALERAAYLQ